MSRTSKHSTARSYHKQWRAALAAFSTGDTSAYSQMREDRSAATLVAKNITRHGNKRRWAAGMKVKDKRSRRCKEKEMVRGDLTNLESVESNFDDVTTPR